MLTDCTYENVHFEGPPSSYISSIHHGLRYPTIILANGPTGVGKSNLLSQYAYESIRVHDADKMYGLSANITSNLHFISKIDKLVDSVFEYNKPGNPEHHFVEELFPEEFIHDEPKIYAFLDNLSNYNKKRMNVWRDIKAKYKDKSYNDFLNNVDDCKKLITAYDTPYVKVDYSSVVSVNKRTGKKLEKNEKEKNKSNIEDNKTNLNNKTMKSSIQYSNKYSLDPVKKIPIKSVDGKNEKNNEEKVDLVAKKLKLYYEKPPCVLLWGSDLIGTPIVVNSNKNKLVSKIMSIRHDGISFLLDVQVIAGGLPRNVRLGGKQFVLFPTEDQKMVKMFWEEVCSSICSFKDFLIFFRNIVDGHNVRFILIDRLENPMQIRLNWDMIHIAKEFIPMTIKKIKEKEKKNKTKKRKISDDEDNEYHNRNKKNIKLSNEEFP